MPPSSMNLKGYRKKRDFLRTPEPSGSGGRVKATDRPIFVVQKHAASRLHYDFRLELDGTLKSWAIPKGPSLDPAQKRLAVHVEDHPLEYAEFEGVIPPKQYGAGTVLIWDRGTWHTLHNAQDGYRNGVLKFSLDGKKLQGAWTLVRMRRRGNEEAGKENWLLIKERDAEAKTGQAGEIVTALPNSVESGRDIQEVKENQPRTWQSDRTQASSSKPEHPVSRSSTVPPQRNAQRALLSSRSQSLIPGPEVLSSLSGAVKRSCPEWIAPQLASLVTDVPSGEDWLHEIKYDGYRILARVARGTVRLYSRNRKDWTSRLQRHGQAITSLNLNDAWLDGEVVVPMPDGKTDFQALQNAFDSGATAPIAYYLFDLMHLNGYDLRRTPLVERKKVLASLLTGQDPGGLLRYSDHIEGQGKEVFGEACRRGLEGLIAKQMSSPYRSGRGRSWLKIKCEQRQEFVIGGFTEPAGSRKGFGALLVGYYEGKRLRYAGKVGTGFTEDTLRTLHRKLVGLERLNPPFADPPTGHEARGAHWVGPQLVAEVRFAEWTKEGILRQPSFQGLRTDKQAAEIVREQPRATVEVRPSAKADPTSRGGHTHARLTNPDRVLYPDIGLTKADLAHYYERIEPWILSQLRGRPLTLLRCPEGYQNCFYQKHVNERVPQAIGRIEIEEDGSRETYMVADSLEAVLGLVQMGVLELHTWGATLDRLDRPDRLTFDLDPDPSVPWAQVVEAARLIKTLLEELGLVAFVKTTGGKGLHVVVPIQRFLGWDEVKEFSKAVADRLVTLIPNRFTSNMAKRARKEKIFIDYLRNARGATAIAAYSPRARPGAPVSVPLTWEELSPELAPDQFTVLSVPDRLTRLRRDPWKGYDQAGRRLTDEMKDRLSRLRT